MLDNQHQFIHSMPCPNDMIQTLVLKIDRNCNFQNPFPLHCTYVIYEWSLRHPMSTQIWGSPENSLFIWAHRKMISSRLSKRRLTNQNGQNWLFYHTVRPVSWFQNVASIRFLSDSVVLGYVMLIRYIKRQITY